MDDMVSFSLSICHVASLLLYVFRGQTVSLVSLDIFVFSELQPSLGLFGMLAHAVLPLETYNVTGQVYEKQPDDDNTYDWWVWLLIALAGVCLISCVIGLLVNVFKCATCGCCRKK